MENLLIVDTDETPAISLNLGLKNFSFKGRCFPENPIEFFSPIIEWFEAYIENPLAKTTVEFDISYMNSSSSKMIFEIFYMLEKIINKSEVKIKWICEEEDLSEEQGLELKSLTKCDLEIIFKEESED
jgi:hypothetical protein